MIGMKQMLEALVRNYPRETKHLAQIFKDSTTSYKYAWFLAIMAIINRDPSLETISLTKIFAEMVSIVWYPVCFFKLSLGIQDILQREILSIFENEKLQPDLNIAILREYVLSKQDIIEKMDFLKKYVPYRFLTPWFDKSLNGKKDHEKNNIIPYCDITVCLALVRQQAFIDLPGYGDKRQCAQCPVQPCHRRQHIV